MAQIPNRYRRTPRYHIIVDNVGTLKPLIGFRRTFLTSSLFARHLVAEGETMQDIALRYYKAPEWWYIIADANPTITFPGDIASHIGTYINIPDIGDI